MTYFPGGNVTGRHSPPDNRHARGLLSSLRPGRETESLKRGSTSSPLGVGATMIVGENESAGGPRGPLRYESRPAPELTRSPRRAAATDTTALPESGPATQDTSGLYAVSY